MNENIRLQEENRVLRIQIGDMNDIQRLQKENDTLNMRIRLEEENKQRLKVEKDNMSRDLQCLWEENITLRANMQRLLEKQDNLKTYMDQLHEKNKEMNQRIQNDNYKHAVQTNEIIRQSQEENRKINSENQRLQQEKNILNREIQGIKVGLMAQKGSLVVSAEAVGRGGYASVYLGYFYGAKVAVKTFHEVILSGYNLRILEREINIASQCRHPNLLQFICAAQNDRQRLLIVTELMDMSLRTLIEQRQRLDLRLTYEEVKSISLDVAHGLNYLHSKKPSPIIHRDVSSANVLLSIGNGTVLKAKVSDYGTAKFMELNNTRNPGAAIYAAPEAGHTQQDPKMDVFSYGILVCEMSICELPDPAQRKYQINRIPNVRIKQLVEICMKIEPVRERPTMQNVIGLWENMLFQ